MKQYDLSIIALYLLIGIAIHISCKYNECKQTELFESFKNTINNQDIKGIQIKNTNCNLEIFPTSNTDTTTWGLRGRVSQYQLDKIYIKDGILHIEDISKYRLSMLKVKDGIKVNIENSPRVKILSSQEVDKRLTNKKAKWRYVF